MTVVEIYVCLCVCAQGLNKRRNPKSSPTRSITLSSPSSPLSLSSVIIVALVTVAVVATVVVAVVVAVAVVIVNYSNFLAVLDI